VKPTPGSAATSGVEFIQASRTVLASDYLPKVQRCFELLSDADLWWRPNASSNAVGNMLLHASGNLRQWIIGGVGGNVVERDRDAEFRATEGAGKAELIALVESTVTEVDRVLADLPEAGLLDVIEVQGFRVTRLHAVYHSVEHFGYHLGQVAYVTKLRTGKDLGIFP
jgi:uncharacterized damage-inducible protein DinB